MKKIASILLLILLTALSAQGQINKVWFKRYEVKSVVPTGFRSIRATVELDLKNRGDQALDVQDVHIVIYRQGKPYVKGTCPSFHIAKGYSKPTAVGTFELCKGVHIWSVLKVLMNLKYEEFSADLTMYAVNEKGEKEPFVSKGYSAQKLIKHQKETNPNK